MDDYLPTLLLGFTIGFFIAAGIAALSAETDYDRAMQEAFDRGYAVQCLGKTGYYWECEK